MRFLFRLIAFIIVVAALLIAAGFLLPREVAVARSTVINAPASTIFPYLESPKKFNEWSPWAARDPKTKYTFSGPDSGVGAKMAWESDHPQVGKGKQEITAVVPDKSVKVALDFGPDGTANAGYTLEPSTGGTKITWDFDTDLGMNPIARWFGLMFDKWIGNDYEVGLKRLKQIVETGAAKETPPASSSSGY